MKLQRVLLTRIGERTTAMLQETDGQEYRNGHLSWHWKDVRPLEVVEREDGKVDIVYGRYDEEGNRL